MKHHCHTQAHTHKHTSQPQVFSFVEEGNKRQWDNERRRWLPLREAMNERSRDGGRRKRTDMVLLWWTGEGRQGNDCWVSKCRLVWHLTTRPMWVLLCRWWQRILVFSTRIGYALGHLRASSRRLHSNLVFLSRNGGFYINSICKKPGTRSVAELPYFLDLLQPKVINMSLF